MAKLTTLRSKKTHDAYQAFQASGGLDDGCRLCGRDPVKEFKYWNIIKNDFPYDLFASKHDMILPKRHVNEEDLNESEIAEFRELKKTYLNKNYEFIFESTTRRKSIPGHYHLHLMVVK